MNLGTIETFLRNMNEQLDALDPEARALQFARLLQLFKAAGVMREAFNFKGSARMIGWLTEKSLAKTPPARIAELIRLKAVELKLNHVEALIHAAQT